MRHGGALRVARLPDTGQECRDGGADVVAEQDGDGSLEAQHAGHAVGAGLRGEALQHRDGGAGALHDQRHHGARRNAERGDILHLVDHRQEHLALRERLHDRAHGVDAHEQQAEREHGLADVLDAFVLRREPHDEADEHDEPDVVAELERHELRGHGGADVGAEYDGDGLAQRHEARADEADGHDRGGAGALQHSGGHRARQHAQHRVRGEHGQDRLHLGAGGLLQALGHHVHAEQEHGQSAEQAEHGFHRSVHAGLPFASSVASAHARESKGYRADGKAPVKGR